MQYMLMIFGEEAAFANVTPTQVQHMLAAYGEYSQALVAAGAMVGGNRLKPTSTASTVRVSGGKSQVLDGPYAETKEQLGGYYIIEAPDLDAALAWAARCPGAATGAIEVRPIWPNE